MSTTKKNRKKAPFKRGDAVYSLYNSEWGILAMTVVSVNGNQIICTHPRFGTGYFTPESIVHATTARSRQMMRIVVAREKYLSLVAKAFTVNKVR